MSNQQQTVYPPTNEVMLRGKLISDVKHIQNFDTSVLAVYRRPAGDVEKNKAEASGYPNVSDMFAIADFDNHLNNAEVGKGDRVELRGKVRLALCELDKAPFTALLTPVRGDDGKLILDIVEGDDGSEIIWAQVTPEAVIPSLTLTSAQREESQSQGNNNSRGGNRASSGSRSSNSSSSSRSGGSSFRGNNSSSNNSGRRR